MLQKFSHIILAVLLMISTMGMAVSKHYCGDDLVSVSMFEEAETCCGDMGCCHTENEFFQVKEDFSAPVISTIPFLAELDILGYDLLAIESLLNEPEQENTNIFVDFSPPPKTIQTVLSLKQVYLL